MSLNEIQYVIANEIEDWNEIDEYDRGQIKIGKIHPFELSDKQFIKRFRLSKGLSEDLINQLTPFINEPTRASAVDCTDKVLMAIRFFATGAYQNNIGESIYFNYSQPTVSRSMNEVINAVEVSGLFKNTISFPSFSKLNANRNQFYQKYGLPGVVGAIDCTHVAIYPPNTGDAVYPEYIYVNRKGYHSINVQLICDADKLIMNVNARFPGSTADSHIWNNSSVLPGMEELQKRYPNMYYLLGDSGYALRPWLHTPLNRNLEFTNAEENYNKTHNAARTVIEHTNGMLKMRFRCCLKHRVLHYHPETASKIINTCCVLHNICVSNNIPMPLNDMNDDDWVDGLNVNPPNRDAAQPSRINPLLVQARLFQRRIINNYF